MHVQFFDTLYYTSVILFLIVKIISSNSQNIITAAKVILIGCCKN